MRISQIGFDIYVLEVNLVAINPEFNVTLPLNMTVISLVLPLNIIFMSLCL